MTARSFEIPGPSKHRHAPEKGRRHWRGLAARLNWLAAQGLYSQLGLVAVLTGVTVLLAFPTPVRYRAGDVAGHTIRAERGMIVTDYAATEHNRAEAESDVSPVFILDDTRIKALEAEAAAVFKRGRELTEAAENPVPGGPLIALGRELEALENSFDSLFLASSEPRLWQLVLTSRFKPQIERQVLSLTAEMMARGHLSNPDRLPALQRQRPVSVVLLSSGNEYILPTAAAILDDATESRILEARSKALAASFSPDEVELITRLAAALTRPNLTFDREETERRLDEAGRRAAKAYMSIRPGEVLVREGAVIDAETLEKIQAMTGSDGGYDWPRKFAGLFVVLFVFINSGLIIAMLYSRRGGYQKISLREQVMLTLLLIIAALMSSGASLFGASLAWDFDFIDSRTISYAMPISAVTMLTAIFFGGRKASFMALFAAVLAAVVSSTGNKAMVFMYSYNGAIAATWCLRNMNERGRLIPASFWVVAVNCLTLLGLTLYGDVPWGRQTAYNFCAAVVSGLLSGVMASGMIPIIESLFGFSTDLKLMELGNLDRPLLRELMLAAPGTYHHSVIVGAMVEAAAEAIGANPHLARVGAYYHDIGKMKKPLYFVENQTGENRHDTLAPSMSALILIGHVKDGVELGRKNRLPKGIVDIAEQHHGTSLMAFFYHKAKEQRQEGQPEINEGDYRYPGPKPRGKEAGLVMLADVCEAATRSLSEPTPAKIHNLVRHLISSVFSDGQLDDCELTGREISEVIANFTTILIGIYHHRIAYPGGRKDAAKETAAPLKKEGPELKKEIYVNLPVEPAKNVTH